jgi:hypothetical protein
LTEREKTILSLDTQIRTHGAVYLPRSRQIRDIHGDALDIQRISAPFATIVVYDMLGKGNTIERNITMEVSVK